MSGESSWLGIEMAKELARVDLSDIDAYEIADNPNPFERVVGLATDEEKRLIVLSLTYALAADAADDEKDYSGMRICISRAKILREILEFRLIERFKTYKGPIEEIGLRSGWRVVISSPQDNEIKEATERFFDFGEGGGSDN